MELFDVLNEDGSFTGYTLSRDEVHRRGLWHRTVHIWLLNLQKELLIQRRAWTKAVFPGLWDVSCAGHIGAGDTSVQAGIRELNEELGLTITADELCYLFTLRQYYQTPDNMIIERELTDVYLLRKDVSVKDMYPDQNEVADIQFISIEQLRKLVFSKWPEMAPHQEEFERLHIELIKHISNSDIV